MAIPAPLGWLLVASFFHFLSLFCLYSTLPLYVLDLGATRFEVGLVMGAFSVASLLARPPLGAWIDRSGQRRFLLAGAAVYVLAALGYLAARSVPTLFLWRLFHALGLASFSTAAASLAGDYGSQRPGATMGLYGLAQAAALSIGPGMGAAVLRAFGYPALFLASASMALAALLCSMAVPEPQALRKPLRAAETAPNPEGFLRRVGPPATAQFAASIGHGIILSFTAVVDREQGFDLVGLYFLLLAGSSLGARLLAGRAYDTWGPLPVLVPAFLVLAGGMGLHAFALSRGLFLTSAVLAGAGIGATYTALLANVVEASRSEQRGKAVAIFTSFWQLGVGGGTIVMGRLADVAGFSVMYLAASALPVLAVGSLPCLRKPPLTSPP